MAGYEGTEDGSRQAVRAAITSYAYLMANEADETAAGAYHPVYENLAYVGRFAGDVAVVSKAVANLSAALSLP